MSTDGHPTKASLRELEPLFADAAGRERAAPRHSTLKLQPTVLPPPPADNAPSTPYGASHEDDLDLGIEADAYARRRQWLLAAAGVAIAIAGTVGYLAFGPVSAPQPTAVSRPPAVVVSPPAEPAPAAPVVAVPTAPAAPAAPPSAEIAVAPPATPSVVAPVTVPPVVAAPPAPVAAAPADTSMGQVSDELVPPSTDGLSPPRKVNAVRIIVDGDREIRPQ